jgi:hypothetical protein
MLNHSKHQSTGLTYSFSALNYPKHHSLSAVNITVMMVAVAVDL